MFVRTLIDILNDPTSKNLVNFTSMFLYDACCSRKRTEPAWFILARFFFAFIISILMIYFALRNLQKLGADLNQQIVRVQQSASLDKNGMPGETLIPSLSIKLNFNPI